MSQKTMNDFLQEVVGKTIKTIAAHEDGDLENMINLFFEDGTYLSIQSAKMADAPYQDFLCVATRSGQPAPLEESMSSATHQARFNDWICTKCRWGGNYSETTGVMYRRVDWQNCPSCGSVAIPSDSSIVPVEGATPRPKPICVDVV